MSRYSYKAKDTGSGLEEAYSPSSGTHFTALLAEND